ncbi:hypothetical protein [Nocardia sp. NPDC052566]|uniref:hypothetical protein n=1 Tax=Nocardia sp. NPDC052566 TaxID=3364330 RepID=UPI0037CA413F
MKRYLIVAAAILVSAVLWHFGTGLHPLAGLAVLAPLPVLAIAFRTSASIAFGAGALSWLLGDLQMWSYYRETIQLPPLVGVLMIGGAAVAYGGLVALTRALLRRGRPGLAVLALPAGWVAVEYLLSVGGPFGAWWSVAYTQSDVSLLIQSAALTGPWGITFLVLLVPAAVAVITAPNVTRAQRIRSGSATAVVLLAVAAFGGWRLAMPEEKDSVRVGLVAVAQPEDYVPVGSPEGRDMVTRVVAEVERLADQGARAVVLPEKSWRADESTLPLLSAPLTEVATRRNVHVVAGVALTSGGVVSNAAIDYPSGVRYAKHFLIPGLEDEFTPGTAYRRIPGEPWALAVCFDLDRPGLVRDNQRRGATLLLVPALDFVDDYWLHSRMAIMRGIESGVGIARSPQLGEIVASDARGRIAGSARTDITVTRSVLAVVPVTASGTLYTRLGDWFAWLSLLLVATACAGAALRSRTVSGLTASNS